MDTVSVSAGHGVSVEDKGINEEDLSIIISIAKWLGFQWASKNRNGAKKQNAEKKKEETGEDMVQDTNTRDRTVHVSLCSKVINRRSASREHHRQTNTVTHSHKTGG